MNEKSCQVMFCFLFVVTVSKAWCTTWLNHVDIFVHIVLISVMMSGSLSVYGHPLPDSISILLVVLVSAALLVAIVALGTKSYDALTNKKHHDAFLSHHKASGKCVARLCKLHLCMHYDMRSFFDADGLEDLGTLFEEVMVSRALVVFLTGETLCREWCCGEISVAHASGIMMIPVVAQRWRVGPGSIVDHSQTLSEEAFVSLVDGFDQLTPYGITVDAIQKARQALLNTAHLSISTDDPGSLTSVLHLVGSRLATSRGTSIRNIIWRSVLGVTQRPSLICGVDHSSTSSCLIVADRSDVEALASQLVLTMMLQACLRSVVLSDQLMTFDEFMGAIRARPTMVLLWQITKNSWDSLEQLGRLEAFLALDPRRSVVPVATVKDVNFPDGEYFNRMQAAGVATESVRLLLRRIAQCIDIGSVREVCNLPVWQTVPLAGRDLCSNKVRNEFGRISEVWKQVVRIVKSCKSHLHRHFDMPCEKLFEFPRALPRLWTLPGWRGCRPRFLPQYLTSLERDFWWGTAAAVPPVS